MNPNPISPRAPEEFSPADNFIGVLSHWAEREPEGTAFCFCVPGGGDPEITYRNLQDRVRSLAAILQERNLAGERLLLLFPPGLDFVVAFLATLAAGAVAVPSDLPRRKGKGGRLRGIVVDSGCALLLTVTEVAARFDPGGDLAGEFASLPVLAIDTIGTQSAAAWHTPGFADSDLAVIQYTSGSTAEPKGVMLSHANLVSNCRMIVDAFGVDRTFRVATWLPAYHDMGLVGGILTPLWCGFPGRLISPATFLGNPLFWLKTISRDGIHVTGGPDFAYQWCVDRIAPEQVAELDLRTWKVAYNGAEPIRPDTLKRFADRFAPAGFSPDAFLPCYGLAEATLIVTGGPPGRSATRWFDRSALGKRQVVPTEGGLLSSQELCASGRILPGVEIAIVDPASGEECAIGGIGEIRVQSPSVGLGYWRRPVESESTFFANLPGRQGTFLRTGDLGFVLDDLLFVTGREKDLLIVRGVNHHPQDLEHSCEIASGCVVPSGVAAFAVDRGETGEIVIVAEIARQSILDGPAEIERIRRRLSDDHDVTPDAVHLVKAGTLPRTSSGKIRRFACREQLEAGLLKPVATWTVPARPASASSFAGLYPLVAAHTGTDPAKLDPGTRLAADLGLDSLGRFALAHRIESHLGVAFPDGSFGRVETMGDLSALLSRSIDPRAPASPDDSTYRFERFPEIERLRKTRSALLAEGFPDPYFRLHETCGAGTTLVEGRELIHFGSYNYLGLSGHPDVSEAACRAVHQYGTSSGASRLVSGNRAIHVTLEHDLADFLGAEAALVFVGGHATNETTLGHLFGPGDLILHDSLSHNSLIEGARLSGARRWSFPHNDTDALDTILTEQRPRHRRVLVVIEGVYSMDGDLPDLARFVELKHKHRCLLMIDEAHSIGTIGANGRGLTEHTGVSIEEIDLLMGTLSKALASCGGFIAGSTRLVDYLRYTAPGFVYSVGMPPPSAAAALAALAILRSEPSRVRRLQDRSRHFHEAAKRRSLGFGGVPGTPVIPYPTGASLAALSLSERLVDRGIVAPPVLHPAVPDSSARLRFFLTSEHSETQIETTLEALEILTKQSSEDSPAESRPPAFLQPS